MVTTHNSPGPRARGQGEEPYQGFHCTVSTAALHVQYLPALGGKPEDSYEYGEHPHMYEALPNISIRCIQSYPLPIISAVVENTASQFPGWWAL